MTVVAVSGPDYAIPHFSRREYQVDAFVHVMGVAAGLTAGPWLVASLRAPGSIGTVLALAAYGISMTAMLLASAAYNLSRGRNLNERLRRVDHACIFFAIAGTYTPLLLRLSAEKAAVALTLVWSIAVAGALLKVSAPRRHERLGLALYIGLGWIGLPLAPALSGLLRHGTAPLIGLGVLIYMLGVGAYLAERLRYHNVIWHLMVLTAAGCHCAAMWVEFG